MDFWRTVLVVFRRWYVTFPAFVLSIGITAAVYSSVPQVYSSTSIIVLTTPLTGGSQPVDPQQPSGITNPLLNFDRGLSMSASIVIQALGTPETAAALGVVPGGDTTYTVGNGSSNPELLTTGPFIFITGESASAESAQDIVTRVAQRARAELADRQRTLDVPAATYITAVDVVPPTTPQARGESRKRAAAATFGLGVLGSLSAAFGVESFCDARRERRRRLEPS